MAGTSFPLLQHTHSGPQLFVNDKPFLMRPGELQNSTFSSPAYMATIWPQLLAMNINTVLAPVAWEDIEPTEGWFHFSVLNENIRQARDHGMKLVLLWFGTFKNARSTYVPAWLKANPRRFPRCKIRKSSGEGLETIELLSPVVRANWEADSKGFSALMRHVQEMDSEDNTVLMVQVENEPGLLVDSRDRSKQAEAAFSAPVPQALLSALRQQRGDDKMHPAFTKRYPSALQVSSGKSWQEAFGDHVDEAFMAHHISAYVGQVASAGKKWYTLPLYVNAWLNADDLSRLDLEGVPLKHDMATLAGGGNKAGEYPSGGVCAYNIPFYQYNAPDLDFLSPDVYLHDYEAVCEDYTINSNPLFIPEQRRDDHGARRMMRAYGSYAALGCTPFGVDTLDAPDPVTGNPGPLFARVFGLLKAVETRLMDARMRGPHEVFGFYFDEVDRKTRSHPEIWTRTFGEYDLSIERAFVFGKPGPGAGIIIHQADGSFLLIGWGYRASFKSTKPNATFTGILKAFEMEKIEANTDVGASLKRSRRLNGDETRGGESVIMPNDEPDDGSFPIAITIPARTYLAECTPYSIFE